MWSLSVLLFVWTQLSELSPVLRTVGTTIGELLKGAKQSTCHSIWSTLLFVTSNLPPQFLPQGPEKYLLGGNCHYNTSPPYVDPSATAMFTLYELMCWQCCCLLLLLDLMAIINSSCGFCYCAIWVWITRGQLSCQCNHCLQTTFEAFHCTFNSFNELSSSIPVCQPRMWWTVSEGRGFRASFGALSLTPVLLECGAPQGLLIGSISYY